MPSPKRRAPHCTAAAIAEDLRQARSVGGLWRADEADLAATLDCLALAETSPEEDPLSRARDLLASYVRRVCERYLMAGPPDKTGTAAAESLRSLLLRPVSDTRLAEVVRRNAAQEAGHSISSHAVRHREDKIIDEIARDVFADLESRWNSEPQSIEAAIHRLVPIVADIRQQLHDGLCLTYEVASPADPRERRAIDGFYDQTVIKLGALLLASTQLADIGRRTPRLSRDDFWFVTRSHHLIDFLFEEDGDREYMREFVRSDRSSDWQQSIERLRAHAPGEALYARWVQWARSCYPTCAFERCTDIGRMCSPHAFVTLLYEIEIKYVELGFTDLDIPGNVLLLHHQL